jgi:CRISPR-associated protein Cmr3
MIRPEDIDLAVDFSGIELEEKGLLRLGGEGKAVSYEVIENKQEFGFPEIKKEFVMYLATPAIFTNGWLPGFINPDDFTGEIMKGLKVKLVSAILSRPQLIGGFDMKDLKPKPMLKAVPAGSVYFFEIQSGDGKLLQTINGKSISDYNEKEGFGISYYGLTNKEF